MLLLMKRLLLLFGISAALAQQPMRYVDPADNIKWLWLSNEKVMSDAMYEMDMHWAAQLAIAEKLGRLDAELKNAPRTIGDGLPWPEHFAARAAKAKKEGAAKETELKSFEAELYRKYKVNSFMVETGTGRLMLSNFP